MSHSFFNSINFYQLIYKACGKDLPIIGCYQLNDNSRKAIDILNLGICKTHQGHSIALCEVCEKQAGFISPCECYEDYELRNCNLCQRVYCSECDESCIYCSDPAGFKTYYCKECSPKCFICKDVICEYCCQHPSFWECPTCKEECMYHDECRGSTLLKSNMKCPSLSCKKQRNV